MGAIEGRGCLKCYSMLFTGMFSHNNVFENSPLVVQAFMGAVEGMRVGLGLSKVL